MKRVLLVSLAASLLVAACGEKTDLKLKARNNMTNTFKPGQQNPQNPSEKTSEEHTFHAPSETNHRLIKANSRATRIVNIQAEDMETNIFCTENVVKSLNEKERIKLQGKSQVILRQSTKAAIPETSNQTPKEEPKPFVSLACLGRSADLSTEPENKNIHVAKLTDGDTIALIGKFSSIVYGFETTAHIGCVSAEKMAKADAILSPQEKDKALDILMAANSKMLIETENDDLKKYILVVCNERSENQK